MFRRLLLLTSTIPIVVGGQLPVRAANARCVVEEAGTSVYDGDCFFRQSGGNGSFSIESPSGRIAGRLSLSVSIIEPGIAEVRGLTVDGINSRWGEARRSTADAACWVGSDFKICAYGK